MGWGVCCRHKGSSTSCAARVLPSKKSSSMATMRCMLPVPAFVKVHVFFGGVIVVVFVIGGGEDLCGVDLEVGDDTFGY